MNRGGDQHTGAQGFTIVETLIVLAVTGSLFVSAALLINGKQNRTDFQVGSRDLQIQFQQIINEVQTGYYPRSGLIKCSVPGAGVNLNFSTGTNADLGESIDCIFVGKTIVFNPSATTRNQYNVYSLAGRRLSATGDKTDVKSPAEAMVTVIPGSTINVKVPNGLEYYKGRISGGSWVVGKRFPLSFMSGLADFKGPDTKSSGGSQRMELRGYTSTKWNSPGDDEDDINYEMNPSVVSHYGTNPLTGAELCFNSGGTEQSVVVNISSGLSVSSAIKAGKNCP